MLNIVFADAPGSLRRQDIRTHDTDFVELVSTYMRKNLNYQCHVNMQAW